MSSVVSCYYVAIMLLLYTVLFAGTVLVDTYSLHTASQHSSPRTALLDRARLIEQIGLPRSAHLYIVAQHLYKLHPDFDAVLIKILLQVESLFILLYLQYCGY